MNKAVGAVDEGFKSTSILASGLKIGILVAASPIAWRYGVSAKAGWPGVSIP